MRKRADFQKILEETLGSTNVYYQAPAGVRMKYPAIIYDITTVHKDPADNRAYSTCIGYLVTLVTKKPDDPTFEKLVHLPMSRFDRHYRADGLYHDVFKIYF